MHTILLMYEEHVKSTFTLTGDHISDLTFTSLINTGFFCFCFFPRFSLWSSCYPSIVTSEQWPAFT